MDAVMKPELVNLPWATLLTLASGYAAYYVANVGVRDHHKPIDVTFSTLVFGFFSAFVYAICRRQYDAGLLTASIVSFASAIVIGALWSLFGRGLLERSLRRSDVSFSDDLPSAWVALFRAKTYASQLSVKLKDGSWLKCENLRVFADHPNGPCVLGAKGDVLMYVTHIKSPDDDDFEACTALTDEVWGDEVTYIPADQIVKIDYRRRRR
jgi:hypothetical protein